MEILIIRYFSYVKQKSRLFTYICNVVYGVIKHFIIGNEPSSSIISGILVTPQEECAHDNNITYNRQGIMGMFLLPKDYYSST